MALAIARPCRRCGPFRGAQTRRTSARVMGDLGGARLDRAAYQQGEAWRRRSGRNRVMSGDPRRPGAAAAQELFDPTILERVERYDCEPPAGRQQLLGRGKAAVELTQFV